MALRPTQFCEYVKDWDKTRYNEKFRTFKEKYDGDRNAYRIYIPFIEDRIKSPNEDSITEFLSRFGFTVENYLGGVARLGSAKNTIKIGKALSNISKRPDTEEKDKNTVNELLKKFGEDSVRKAGGDEFLICISRHPYDIAGADTDRKWYNCMTIPTWDKNKLKEHEQLNSTLTGKEKEVNEKIIERLKGGSNISHLIHDVREGSIVAYIVRKNDRNINNPIAVLNIKPFINKNDENDFILVEDSKVYGQDVPGFKEKVAEFLNDFNGLDKEGYFCMNSNLYGDDKTKIIKGDILNAILPDKTKQDEFNRLFNNLFENMKETTHTEYTGHIFFYTTNNCGTKEVWMEDDSVKDVLWCRSDDIWNFIEKEFNLDYTMTQILIKLKMEGYLNKPVRKPMKPMANKLPRWEFI